MSSSDGSDGANFSTSRPPGRPPAASVDTLLFESLCHVLIEKGVLTKNDALSVIQTVAQVRRGALDGGPANVQNAADLDLLRRMFTSFEMLDDRPTEVNFSGGNVHLLRPPVHGDRPEFPEDD